MNSFTHHFTRCGIKCSATAHCATSLSLPAIARMQNVIDKVIKMTNLMDRFNNFWSFQDGVNWLSFLNKYKLHGILCDDMGLGKTLQSICILAGDHYLRYLTAWTHKQVVFQADYIAVALHASTNGCMPCRRLCSRASDCYIICGYQTSSDHATEQCTVLHLVYFFIK